MPVHARGIPRTQPPGFVFYLLTITIILICVQSLIYLLVLKETIGPFSVLGTGSLPDPVLARQSAAVVLGGASGPETPEGLARVERWRLVARELDVPLRVTTPDRLPQVLDNASVLLLPHASHLDPAAREAIVAFVKSGRGVVASGPVGTRTGDGEWTGWDFLTTLTATGGAESATVPAATAAFRGGRFFSGAVAPGTRIALHAQDLAIVHTGEGDVFWSDWMLRPAGGRALDRAALAASARHAGGGRVSWLGFDIVLKASRAGQQAVLDGFLGAALAWAGRLPVARTAEWPRRQEGAVVVAQTAQGDLGGAAATAAALGATGLPVTSFVSTHDAGRQPDALRTLHRAGEVGWAGDGPAPFATEPEAQQAYRLRTAREALEKATGAPVRGFAPPQGVTTPALVAALNEAGYDYYVDERAVTRAAPEIVEFRASALFPLQKRTVAKLFRLGPDDFDVLAAEDPAADLGEAFFADAQRVRWMGGAYAVRLHGDLIGEPHREALRRLAGRLRESRLWTATAGDVARWWAARGHVTVTVKRLGPQRLGLEIANMGHVDLEEVGIDVHLPYRPTNVALRSTRFRFRAPRFTLGQDEVLRIDLPRLGKQTSSSFMVAMDE